MPTTWGESTDVVLTQKSRVDTSLSTQSALQQLFCNQRKMEEDANMIGIDLARLAQLEQKYGPANFKAGALRLQQDRERLTKKLIQTEGHIRAYEERIGDDVAYLSATAEGVPQADVSAVVAASAAAPPSLTPASRNATPLGTHVGTTSAVHSTRTSAHHSAAAPQAHPLDGTPSVPVGTHVVFALPSYADSRILSNSKDFMAGH